MTNSATIRRKCSAFTRDCMEVKNNPTPVLVGRQALVCIKKSVSRLCSHTIHHLKGLEKECKTESLRRGLCSKTHDVSRGMTDRSCRKRTRRAFECELVVGTVAGTSSTPPSALGRKQVFSPFRR